MKHYGDITKLHGDKVEAVDIITGGSPCQDLSVAGKRAGLAGERSGLFMDQIRIIKEMRCKYERDRAATGADVNIRDIKPRYMVWENVPGAFSSGTPKGADFGAVLEETIKVVVKEVPAIPIPPNGWSYAGTIEGVGDNGVPFSLRGERITLNTGEYPNDAAVSRLSQILEVSPHPKYCLSPKACQGILYRAKKRGKELPPILKEALEQSAFKNEQENLGGARGS